MADVIAKLKLESGEFDSKVQRAVGALKTMERECHNADKTLAVLEKDQKEYVQSLGRMETVSNTLRGKINELSSAYVELRSQYNRLTDEEKQGDFGKALNASLQQLKERVEASKKELADINNELNGSNGLTGALDAVAQKFGLNIKQLGTLGGALAVGKVAWEGIQRTMQSTETTADAVASAQLQLNTAVDSFFRSIAEGNFSNFLNGLSDVARRAREAYEAMDELGSFATRFNPRNQADMQKIDTLLREARALMAKGDKAGAAAKTEEAKRVADQAAANTRAYGEREYAAGMSTLRNLLGKSGVNFTDAQIAYYSDPKNWEETQQRAEKYAATLRELRQAEANLAGIGQSGNQKMINAANERYNNALAAFNSLSARDRRAYAYINTPDSPGTANGDAFVTATQQIYGRQRAQTAVDAIYARIERADAMANRPTGGGSGGGSKEVTIQQQIAALEREALTATAKRQNEIRATIHLLDQELARQKEIVASLHGGQSDPVSDFWKAVNRGDPNASLSGPISTKVPQGVVKPGDLKKWEDYYAAIEKPLSPLREMEAEAARLKEAMEDAASPEQYQQLNAELSAVVEKMNKFKGETVVKAGEDATESWRAAASAIQSVGSALGSIQDPATKVMSIIAQAIATIALSYAQASSMAAKNPANAGWGWVAFAATGAATMISSIAAIKSATAGSYAEGGIVPGRSFSGDNLTANVNSGEVILSVAQANTIASILQGGGSQQSGGGTPYVTGEQIYMGLSNYLRRTGRGELITAR